MASREPAMTEQSTRTMSPRRRRYMLAITLSVLLGGVLGGWLAIANPDGPAGGIALIDGSPLTRNFAIGASILWVAGMGLCMLLYHRAIDDHEERAWLWACLAGWYSFMFSAPVWWVLHRASLAPPPDAMLLFLGSLVVNAVVWLWLKYR